MKKQIGFMAFSTYIRTGSQILIFLLLARFLGAEQFGQFAYWVAIATLVALPINYGFGMQLLREGAQTPERLDSILLNMLSAKLVLTLIVLFFSVLFSTNIDRLDLYWLFLGMTIADSFAEFFNFALRSQGQFAIEARLALASSLIQFLLLISFTLIFTEVVWVAFSFLISRIIALLLTWRTVGRQLSCKEALKAMFTDSMVATLRSGFPYAADMGVSTINSVIDTVILKHMSDLRTVGIYQAGVRLLLGGVTPAAILSNVYLPGVSAQSKDNVQYAQVVKSLNLKMVAIGGAISFSFALFSSQIANNFFGKGYADLAELMPWFALVLLLRYVAASFGINLTASGHQSIRVVSNLIYLAVFLVGAFLLVPSLGGVGLLMASSCSMLLLIFIYYAYLTSKKLPTGFNGASAIIFTSVVTIITVKIIRGLQ